MHLCFKARSLVRLIFRDKTISGTFSSLDWVRYDHRVMPLLSALSLAVVSSVQKQQPAPATEMDVLCHHFWQHDGGLLSLLSSSSSSSSPPFLSPPFPLSGASCAQLVSHLFLNLPCILQHSSHLLLLLLLLSFALLLPGLSGFTRNFNCM